MTDRTYKTETLSETKETQQEAEWEFAFWDRFLAGTVSGEDPIYALAYRTTRDDPDGDGPQGYTTPDETDDGRLTGATVFADIPVEIHGDEGDNILDGNAYDNKIFGHGGNDTITGATGTNTIFGGDGNDEIYGGNQTDFLAGNDGTDLIFGGEGGDYIFGGYDADTIFGGAGNDEIYGDPGDDEIYGEEGDDRFIDGSGDDTYTGGDGADTFAFTVFAFRPKGGMDTVVDFELGVDKLEIGNYDTAFTDLSFAEYIDQHAFGTEDPGVVIEWEHGLIRLEGISVEDLTPWDIILV